MYYQFDSFSSSQNSARRSSRLQVMVYGGQLLFLFHIFIHFSVLTINAQLVYYSCSDGNYTTNGTYQRNLDMVLPSFYSNSNNIVNRFGFYNVSVGESPDTVNAIGLCKGDVEPNICRACLNASYSNLRVGCPSQKGAIGWDHDCFVRYSNQYILNTLETSPAYFEWQDTNASNVDQFNQVLSGLLNRLKGEASTAGSIRKFATGNESGPGFFMVYALVQCTPDLSELQCVSCLEKAAQYLSSCCDGKISVDIFTPNCILYQGPGRFFNNTPPIPSSLPADALSPALLLPPRLLSPLTSPSPPPLAPPPSSGNILGPVLGIVLTVISVLGAALLIYICCCKRKRRQTEPKGEDDAAIEPELEDIRPATDNFSAAATNIFPAAATEYDMAEIRHATNNFSKELGRGAFGAVYEGRLQNGKRIAVKKLIRDSTQADRDLRNEVSLLAKLQHRNLVSLLGFCRDGTKILLLYELVANATLDNFIFVPLASSLLAGDEGNLAKKNWDTLYKIIVGVARGLVYLHIDSQLQIIHRDLKPSNILLDKDMNPKIADFGTARLLRLDATHRSTDKIIGSYGYMAPEYVSLGQYSVKTDVYSFGIILLEMLTGKKISQSPVADDPYDNLLSYVWRNWQSESISDKINSALSWTDPSSLNTIMRCIHIGLLCVQEDTIVRPTMDSVSEWLHNQFITLDKPNTPAFLVSRNRQGSSVQSSQARRESTEYLTGTEFQEDPTRLT